MKGEDRGDEDCGDEDCGDEDRGDDVMMVYMTTGSEEDARKVSSHLLERRLIACANWFPIRSMYWWQGKIENEGEFGIIAKTTRSLADTLIEEARSVHSYDVPCIEMMKVEGGNPDYLNWVRKETGR